MTPQCSGHVGESTQPEQAECQVSQGGKGLGGRSGANLRPILVKGNIPHPEQGVFDVPVTPGQSEEAPGIRLSFGETCDAIGYIVRLVITLEAGDGAFDSEYLCCVGKVEVLVEEGAGSDRSGFNPSVALIPFSVRRGKNRPHPAF